ncbi:MAG: type II toxin-antitoxin system RatA family toxin [Chromatiaceae bacterium]|jgi:coenzyme Q-binding protein COQ10|nr:MAG: type II toxin-antitoxin system RatA family toxin [Chromatiaceae bacterium]
MPSFTVRETVHHLRAEVFDLVADIERYPDFVPGWQDARVVSQQGNRRQVQQALGIGPIVLHFRTEAVLERPERISIHGQGGPLKRLHQVWHFEEGAEGGTLVELWTDYALRGGLAAAAVGPFFRRRTQDVVQAFRRRADQVLRD